MTNEQLAGFIKQGRNDELLPLLWGNVQKLLYLKSDKAYKAYSDRFKSCGVELWDIRQSCYMAFLHAVKGYDTTKKYKFTSYLSYPFKTMIAELLGNRKRKKEPLNYCTSLEFSVGEKDDTLILGDMIVDDNAVDVQQLLDTESDGEVVRCEVAKLKPAQRRVVEMHYFENIPIKDIAVHLGVSYQRVSQIRDDAFRALRSSHTLYELYIEINGECHLKNFIQPDRYYLKYRR